jgi:hypothetical protein
MRRSTLALALASILTLGITAAAPAHAERAGRAFTVLGKTWCLGAPEGVRCDLRVPMTPAVGAASTPTATSAVTSTAKPTEPAAPTAPAAPNASTAAPTAAASPAVPSIEARPDSIVGRWLALARERAAASR